MTIFSVMTRSTVAQPATPSVGDRYIVPVAATGAAWAGKDGRIAVYLASGWFFAIAPIGSFIYVEDETAFYHRNSSGIWTAGVGSITLGPGSIALTSLIGANASTVVKVENRTTNAPPASPIVPTAYIIGPSPTGAWAGNAGKLAMCLSAGSFTIITPVVGDEVFDKSANAQVTFNGTTWVSSAGAWTNRLSANFPSSLTGFSGPAAVYVYDPAVAPQLSCRATQDFLVLTHTAKKAGAVLNFRYRASATVINRGANATPGNACLTLSRDNIASAVDWALMPNVDALAPVHAPAGGNSFVVGFDVGFETTAPDTNSHEYKMSLTSSGNGAFVWDVIDPTRRLFTVEEAA